MPALQSGNSWLLGITRERLEQERQSRLGFPVSGAGTGATKPFLPFAHGNFRTPSGKAELYSEAMKALGLDPVAEFKPARGSRSTTQGQAKFPLELPARKADHFLNSSFSNLPSLQAMEETGFLEMHAADAEARAAWRTETRSKCTTSAERFFCGLASREPLRRVWSRQG